MMDMQSGTRVQTSGPDSLWLGLVSKGTLVKDWERLGFPLNVTKKSLCLQ